MPKLARVGSVVCVVSLVLAFGGGIAHAGIGSVCVAADGKAASLLVQVDDKKSKKKNHDKDSGLSECTIVGAGGGGGCKSGFDWKCEKLKSGKKCCGCVAAKGTGPQNGTTAGTDAAQDQRDTQTKAEGRFGVGYDAVPPAPPPAGQGGQNQDNVLWGDYVTPAKPD